jgi:hypothetical protein
VGISDELLGGDALLGWNVLGAVILGGAGVGVPIDGAAIPAALVGGATNEGCAA